MSAGAARGVSKEPSTGTRERPGRHEPGMVELDGAEARAFAAVIYGFVEVVLAEGGHPDSVLMQAHSMHEAWSLAAGHSFPAGQYGVPDPAATASDSATTASDPATTASDPATTASTSPADPFSGERDERALLLDALESVAAHCERAGEGHECSASCADDLAADARRVLRQVRQMSLLRSGRELNSGDDEPNASAAGAENPRPPDEGACQDEAAGAGETDG
jgi:hypothetical protein